MTCRDNLSNEIRSIRQINRERDTLIANNSTIFGHPVPIRIKTVNGVLSKHFNLIYEFFFLNPIEFRAEIRQLT